MFENVLLCKHARGWKSHVNDFGLSERCLFSKRESLSRHESHDLGVQYLNVLLPSMKHII